MSRPFDNARYAGLLEGLEASEALFSETIAVSRLDAEYFRPAFIALQKRLESIPHTLLGEKSMFVAGPFGSEFHVENYEDHSPFRYIRGKDVKSFFLESGDNVNIPKIDYDRLSDHAVKKDDVLISVVGTIGNACIATTRDLPAIFSCKSTIIRRPEVNPYYLTSFLNSELGKALMLRSARGSVQLGLNLPDLRQLVIPVFSKNFQGQTESIVLRAHDCLAASESNLALAEQTVLRAVGLQDWHPPEPHTYIQRASNVFGAGRLDADYFAPRVAELMQRLGAAGLTIGDVAPTRRERFTPGQRGEFDYIEIGSVCNDGTVGAERLPQSEAPSRATSFVRTGDVITSSVRPIRRLSALITPTQNGFVCSSGFVVLQPLHVPAEVLLTFLRLPPVCELMDLHTSASLYPAISEVDLLALPFHPVDQIAEAKIVMAVRAAHDERRKAHALLKLATQVVEVAIEKGEVAAVRLVRDFVE